MHSFEIPLEQGPAVAGCPLLDESWLLEVGRLFKVNNVFEGVPFGRYAQLKLLNRAVQPFRKLKAPNVPFVFAAKNTIARRKIAE